MSSRSPRKPTNDFQSARVQDLYSLLKPKETAALLHVDKRRLNAWRAGRGTMTEREKRRIKDVYDDRSTLRQIIDLARETPRKNTHEKIAKELVAIYDTPNLGDHRFKRRQRQRKTFYQYDGRMSAKDRERVAEAFGRLGLPGSGLGAIYFRRQMGARTPPKHRRIDLARNRRIVVLGRAKR